MKTRYQTHTNLPTRMHNVVNLFEYKPKCTSSEHTCILWTLLAFGTKKKLSQWIPPFEEVQSWISQYRLEKYRVVSRTQVSNARWIIEFSLTYTHKHYLRVGTNKITKFIPLTTEVSEDILDMVQDVYIKLFPNTTLRELITNIMQYSPEENAWYIMINYKDTVTPQELKTFDKFIRMLDIPQTL